MTSKTIAQLRLEITDKFRTSAVTNQSLPERLTEFLNNVVDSLEALYPSISLLLSGAGAPVDYTDGDPVATGTGVSPPGGLYIDTTAGEVYKNTGTAAQPTWVALADAADL